MAVIETDRLALWRPTEDDIPELIAMHTHRDVERYMDRFGEADALAWLERVNRCWTEHGYGRMIVSERRTGSIVGRSGLQFFDDSREVELGWTLRRDAWGNGYATEAARAVACWAHTEHHHERLISAIEIGNDRSVRVARRLGMRASRAATWFGRSVEIYCVSLPLSGCDTDAS